MKLHFAALSAAVASVHAYDLPENLRTIYQRQKSGACTQKLAGGFGPGSGNDRSYAYCGDVRGAVYLHSQRNGGQYADMDIDCDGSSACPNDHTGQPQTAFQDTIQSYNVGIRDLEAGKIPYVVLGNDGDSPSFDPQTVGVHPLSVVAVICGGKLHYGIWGDTNGGTSVGEASIGMAALCFPGDNLDGGNGHGERDVLYLAFKGKDAVPGAHDANWKANSPYSFEKSIKVRGDMLVAGLE